MGPAPKRRTHLLPQAVLTTHWSTRVFLCVSASLRRKTGRRCIIVIVKRVQLYLDKRLLDVIKVHARISKSTVSDVVTQVLQEKYFSPRRIEILKSMVGLWKDRDDKVT